MFLTYLDVREEAHTKEVVIVNGTRKITKIDRRKIRNKQNIVILLILYKLKKL